MVGASVTLLKLNHRVAAGGIFGCGLRDCGSTKTIGLGSPIARRRRAAARNPSARADGNEDAVPIGTNSQPADKLDGRADRDAVLLRVCESSWFTRPHTPMERCCGQDCRPAILQAAWPGAAKRAGTNRSTAAAVANALPIENQSRRHWLPPEFAD